MLQRVRLGITVRMPASARVASAWSAHLVLALLRARQGVALLKQAAQVVGVRLRGGALDEADATARDVREPHVEPAELRPAQR